jgi:hypothetical protein
VKKIRVKRKKVKVRKAGTKEKKRKQKRIWKQKEDSKAGRG